MPAYHLPSINKIAEALGGFRGHRIGVRRSARNRPAVDEYHVRRRARVRWRLLDGGKADAADKCQRGRAGAHEITSHGCLLLRLGPHDVSRDSGDRCLTF
jgi:hypothetical protein